MNRILATLVLAVVWPGIVLAQDGPQADDRALNRIFGEEFLRTNVDAVCRTAADLPPDDRYQFLLEWVLPSRTHESIRVSAEFAAWDPRVQEHDAGLPQLLASPVFDLIDVAKELGRIDELRDRVADCAARDDEQQRCRLALLILIEIAAEDFESALTHLIDLNQRSAAAARFELRQFWPETLVMYRGVEHPELLELVASMLQLMLDTQVFGNVPSSHRQWNALILYMRGRQRYVETAASHPGGPAFLAPPPLESWVPVSHRRANTIPAAPSASHWEWEAETVTKLAAAEDSWLYFRSPLTDDYEVECDLGGFGFRDTHLVVGGTYVALHFDHQHIGIENLRGPLMQADITPRLSETGQWIHTRTIVRDGMRSIHFDGQLVHQEPHAENAYPWLAVRAPVYGNSQVRDLRITGHPQVPESVQLAADAALAGWISYFEDSVGGSRSHWRFDPELGPAGGIQGRQRPELAGSCHESLLQYHRPILEDGVIEYEFFHEPGSVHSHPAIGRQAFLLEPEGVRVHWVTNRTRDRSGLDPANAEEPFDRADQSDAAALLLAPGWNTLQVRVTGNRLELVLNGTSVHQGELPPSGDRTFGVFHYSDQTEARFRNMVWTGEWPREVPSLAEQELRGTRTDLLDATLPDLAAEFDFDFQSGAAWEEEFFLESPDGLGQVSVNEQGLRMAHPGTKPFNHVWIAPSIMVRGDFDIVAEFEDLDLVVTGNGGSGIHLTIATADELKTHSHTYLGMMERPDIRSRRIAHTEFDYFLPQSVGIVFEGTTSEATTSGRLRLARRGTTQYFLVAEADSTNYRLIHQQDVNDADLMSNGLRLAAATYSDGEGIGSVGVTWKRLTVRADTITHHGGRLNLHRIWQTAFRNELAQRPLSEWLAQADELPLVLTHDFGDGLPEERFPFRGPVPEDDVEQLDDGVRVTRPGGAYAQTAIAPQVRLTGDFDITVTFEDLQAEVAAGGHGCVHLDVSLANEQFSECQVYRKIARYSGPVEQLLQSATNEVSDRGKEYDVTASMTEESFSGRLRLVRQGEWILSLYLPLDADEYRLVSAQKLGTAEARSILLTVETAGEGRSSAIWKDITIRAESAAGSALTEPPTEE